MNLAQQLLDSAGGHPEQPARAMHTLLATMTDRLPAAELDAARARIDGGRPDADLWGRWMMSFLKR